ncbi:MAG: hypothetical protein ACTSPD_16675 [Promethearchaeota archaeon]
MKKIFILIIPITIVIIFIFAFTLGIKYSLGPDIILIILIVIPVLLLFFFTMKKSMNTCSESNICFTDKAIYHSFKFRYMENVDSTSLPYLKAVIFSKKKWDKGKDKGTIEFIPEYNPLQRQSFILTCIPNMSELQKIIESIIYLYGNIEKRWEDIKLKLKLQIPFEIKISQELTRNLSRKKKQNIILIPFTILLILFGIFMFPIIFNQKNNEYFELYLYIAMIPLITGLILLISAIYKLTTWNNRAIDLDNVLTIDSDKIILSQGNSAKTINLNDKIVLNFLSIQKLMRKAVKWDEYYDGIEIKPSYDSKDKIKFGPIDRFVDIYEFLFTYLLKWKADHGFLLKKEELLNINQQKFDFMHKDVKNGFLAKKLAQKVTPQTTRKMATAASPKKKKEIDIAFIDKSDLLYKKYDSVLDSDEKIYLKYIPPPKSKAVPISSIIVIIVSIIIYILYIFIDIHEMSHATYLFFAIVAPLSFLMCCTSSICLYINSASRLRMGNALHLFTDRKIIVETRFEFCIIPYNKITSIVRLGRSKKKYHIQITTSMPIENNPYAITKGRFKGLNENLYFIKKIPFDNDLIDKISYFKENAPITPESKKGKEKSKKELPIADIFNND